MQSIKPGIQEWVSEQKVKWVSEGVGGGEPVEEWLGEWVREWVDEWWGG